MRKLILIRLTALAFAGCICSLQGQNTLTAKSVSVYPEEAAHQSSIFSFLETGESPDTSKATLSIRVLDKSQGNEPVQGATVLLKRDDDKMLGRVTLKDGRCQFSSSPASYTLRVQMTGLKTLEKTGIILRGGSVYDLEVRMAKNQ